MKSTKNSNIKSRNNNFKKKVQDSFVKILSAFFRLYFSSIYLIATLVAPLQHLYYI